MNRNNNTWLNRFSARHHLTRADIAAMVCVSQSTVDRWLQPKIKNGKPNPTYRHMPNMAVKLLILLSNFDQED